MNNILHQYKNGNVDVTIYENGTKVREWPDGEDPIVEYPESCDVKITQYCDMDKVCVYCHEQSNREGKHGDLSKLMKIWETQMPGTEMAIGGGNPLEHPDLIPFLSRLKTLQMIPNITVNMMHMKKFAPMIESLQARKHIYGLGISYRGVNSMNLLPSNISYDNAVFHMIMGVHDLVDCQTVIDWCNGRNILPKILLLGYKTFGNGASYYSGDLQKKLELWKESYIDSLLNTDDNVVISFDNLAIKQLDLQNKVDKKTWDSLFQGIDGNHTFYMDAVKQEVSRTSTSSDRYNYNGTEDIRNLFKQVRV